MPNCGVNRAEIVVDVDAIRHNVETLRARVAPALMMTVVKADGYGHGLVESRPGRASGRRRLARRGVRRGGAGPARGG